MENPVLQHQMSSLDLRLGGLTPSDLYQSLARCLFWIPTLNLANRSFLMGPQDLANLMRFPGHFGGGVL